jgi:hypothetical protein
MYTPFRLGDNDNDKDGEAFSGHGTREPRQEKKTYVFDSTKLMMSNATASGWS